MGQLEMLVVVATVLLSAELAGELFLYSEVAPLSGGLDALPGLLALAALTLFCIALTHRQRRHLMQRIGELEENARQWAELVDRISLPVLTHDAEGILVRANRAFYELVGQAPAQVIGQPYWQALGLAGTTPGDEHATAVVEGRPFQIRRMGADPAAGTRPGTIVQLEWLSAVAGRPGEPLKRLFESAPKGLALVVATGGEEPRVLDLNGEAERLVGMPREAAVGQPLATLLGGPLPRGVGELAVVRKDGVQIPVLFGRSVSDHDFALFSFLDLTAIRAAQQALKESEERFGMVIRNSPIVVFMQDRALRYTWVFNSKHHSTSDILGRSDPELFGPEEGGRLEEMKRAVLDSGTGMRSEFRIAVGGESFYYDISMEPVRGPNGTVAGVTGVATDVTGRHRYEEELRRRVAELDCLYSISTALEQESSTVETVWSVVQVLPRALCSGGGVARVRLRDICFESSPAAPGRLLARSDIWVQGKPEGVVEVFAPTGAEGDLHPPAAEPGRLLDEVAARLGRALVVRRARDFYELASTVFQAADEGIMVTDAHNRIEAVNPALSRITGYASEEVIGRNPRVFSSGWHDAAFYGAMWEAIYRTGHWEGEIWNRRKSGEVYPEWLSVVVVRDEWGNHSRYVALFRDITQRKEMERRIVYRANHDALTGLPNRSLLFDRLNTTLARVQREGRGAVVLFVDLDRFKEANDRYGHEVGDQVLRITAHRLRTCVREADTVARYGGDEFVVLLGDLGDPLAPELVSRHLLERLAKPLRIDSVQVALSASVGIARYPDDGLTPEALLKSADSAMYAAKKSGRNTFRFFSPEADASARQHLSMEAELRRALEKGELRVVYQPIVDVHSGRLTGAEALLRWAHPERGLLEPRDFLAALEASPLMQAAGEWLLRRACGQLRRWRRRCADFQLTVNLSLRQCRTVEGCGIIAVLREESIPGEWLVADFHGGDGWFSDVPLTALRALRDAGVHLCLANFERGYAPLSGLTELATDRVKIDSQLVRSAATEPSRRALLDGIVALAHELGIKVVAVGVESPEEADLVRAHKADLAQGFLYGVPLTAREFGQLLAGSGA